MEQVCALEEYRLPYFIDRRRVDSQQQAETQKASLLLLYKYQGSVVPVWEGQKAFSAINTGWSPSNSCLATVGNRARGSGVKNAKGFLQMCVLLDKAIQGQCYRRAAEQIGVCVSE